MAKLGRFAWEAAKGDQQEAPKVAKPEILVPHRPRCAPDEVAEDEAAVGACFTTRATEPHGFALLNHMVACH